MGGCCGKSTPPKDPDKTPYAPTKKRDSPIKELATDKVPKPAGPTQPTTFTKPSETKKQSADQLNGSGKQTAQVDKDNDSFVIIELPKDNESQPKVIEPVSAKSPVDAKPTVTGKIPDSPKKDDTSSASPKKSPSPPARVTPIALPKDGQAEEIKETIFSPRPIDTVVKADVIAPHETETPVKAAIDIASKIAVADRDDSSTSSLDENVVSAPDVILRIDEPTIVQKVEAAAAKLPEVSAKVEPEVKESVIKSEKVSTISTSISVNKSETKSKEGSPPKSLLPSPKSASAAASSFGFAKPSIKKEKDEEKKQKDATDEEKSKPKEGGFSSFSFTKKEVTKTISSNISKAVTVKETVTEEAKTTKESTSSAIESIKEGATTVKEGVVTVKESVTTIKEDMSKVKEVAPAALKGATSIKEGAVVVKEGVLSAKAGLLDKNQNKASPTEIKKEMPNDVDDTAKINKDAETESSPSPVRVSKLPSPLSPTAPSGLRMPSINAKSPSLTSPTERKAPASIKVSPSEVESTRESFNKDSITPISLTALDKTDAAKPEKAAPVELKITEINKDEVAEEKPEVKLQSPVQVTTPVSSKPLSPTVAPPKPQPEQHVNGTIASPPPVSNKIIPLLPDFTASNAVVTKKHVYCPNTRTAILTAIDKWFTNSSQDDPRVTSITADGGMGKTTLCKELSHKYSDSLAAFHFFNYNNTDQNHNDFKSVLLWFVRCLIQKVDSYEESLPPTEDAKEIIENRSLDDILQKLIFAPLQSLRREPGNRMLVVIDALDECYYADRAALFKFVDEFSSKTPKWLYLCVSLRNDNQLAEKLSNVKNITIKNSNDNMADMKRIMKESLGNFMDRISLDGGLTQLAKKTQGLPLCAMLYNRLLASLNKDVKIALREIDVKFATTIDGVLSNILSNFKKSLDAVKGAEQKYAKLLGMLACARQPINQTVVAEAGFKDIDEILEQLSSVVDRYDNEVVVMHRVIAEWILDQTRGDNLGVDATTAKSTAAENCIRWLEPLMNESSQEVNPGLVDYATKHAVSHLIDKPKEQENVANALCSLRVMQRKLKLSGIDAVSRDYKHEHEQIDHSRKHVSLQEYMKKAPKIEEQIRTYKMLIKNNDKHLKYTPSALYQVAANYTKSPRIQQNARIELTSAQWLEDLTSVEDSHCTVKLFSNEIVSADISPDGKTLVFITVDAEKNIHLHQYNAHSLEPKIPLSDITKLSGLSQENLLCKVLPDGVHVFVGSLQMLVDSKGKSVPSHYDVSSIDIKEKFVAESCAISPKFLAVSLTTFPFNGRSVHMTVIGLKEKKAVKTLEVMKFRFGGNAQFGVKGCAISPDEKVLAACFKQNNKHEIKVNTWDMAKWTNLHSVTVPCISLISCDFGEMSTLLMNLTISNKENKCVAWKISSEESPVAINEAGAFSALSVNKSHVAMCSVNKLSGTAKLSKWKRSQAVQKTSGSTFKIHGIEDMRHVFIHSGIVISDSQSIKVFDLNDLEDDGTNLDNPSNVQVGDMNVESVAFMPRSDTLVINTIKQDEATVYICDSFGDGAHLKDTPMSGHISWVKPRDQVFKDRAVTVQNMFVSNDGTCYILNLGKKILLWSSSNDEVVSLPQPAGVSSDAEVVLCLPSPKDNTLAVVYSNSAHVVHIIDIKTMKGQKQIELEQSPISDLSFMPSNGYLLTFQRDAGNKFTIWNQRSGKQVSEDSVDAFFVSVSHALDRLALSRKDGLQLRSSDNKVCTYLDTKGQWSGTAQECDAVFSPDGTVLVGVDNALCRIWSAGNGEFLQDIRLNYTGAPFIIGMPTNTHVAICDGRVSLVDIASGEVLCVAPLPSPYDRSKCRLNVSPRGGIIAGAGTDGRAIVYRLHNFSAIKMKTSLQRMKSFRK